MAVFEAVLAGQFPGSAPFGGLCPDSRSGRFAAHFCPDEPVPARQLVQSAPCDAYYRCMGPLRVLGGH